MSQLMRTLLFAAVGVVCVAAAYGTSLSMRPARLSDTALAGEKFYPDFTQSTDATALRVAAFDKDTATSKVFNVEYTNGLWRIPSHHNYPADGEELLAKTAASVVGIERGTFAGKTPEDHKRTGVLDPMDNSIRGTEGRGTRVTLYKGKQAVVDLIIGHKLPDAENDYYVRKADDARVFRTHLANFKVSTKFADWIEPDLLQLDRNDLTSMIVDLYHVDEERGAVVQEEINQLRKDDAGKWTLEGLDPASEQIKNATVNQMTSSLDDLRIVGVRPKPAGLIASLKGEAGAGLTRSEIAQMQRNGFFLTPDGQLVSNEGEILAGTKTGVRYTLRFGEVFSGNDLEIEVGGSEEGGGASASGDDAPVEDASQESDADVAADSAAADVNKKRYLFITVAFDESMLGERPQPPVKPEPPASGESPQPTPASEATGEEPAATPEPATDSPKEPDAGDSTPPAAAGIPHVGNTQLCALFDEPTETDAEAQPDATADTAADPAAPAESSVDAAAETGDDPAGEPAQTAEPDAAVDPQQQYEQALAKYNADLEIYEQQLADFEERVVKGKQKVEELNTRFAEWYYVIAADAFTKLHVNRSELVEPKPAEAAGSAPAAEGGAPTESTEPSQEAVPADGDAPASETGVPASAKPDESPTGPATDAPQEGESETGDSPAAEVETGTGEPAETEAAAPAPQSGESQPAPQ